MFFDNVNWKITGSGIEEVKEAGGVYVWTNNIIPHKVKVLPEPFTIKRAADGSWDVTVNPHDSHYMDYLINSSRVHWRKELEELWADKDQDQAAATGRSINSTWPVHYSVPKRFMNKSRIS